MTILKEFREFIARGNVIDLAVGVIIGGAFGKIVTSVVNDLVMPPIGLILGGVDFSSFKWVLRAADPTKKIAEVAIGYGAFVSAALQFLIVALVIFAMVKAINSLRRKTLVEDAEAAAEAPPPPPTPAEVLLTEIRDLLAHKGPSA